jgi:hypothetical protein
MAAPARDALPTSLAAALVVWEAGPLDVVELAPLDPEPAVPEGEEVVVPLTADDSARVRNESIVLSPPGLSHC